MHVRESTAGPRGGGKESRPLKKIMKKGPGSLPGPLFYLHLKRFMAIALKYNIHH